MTKYLLDTNHASPLVTLNHPLRKQILYRLSLNDEFSICLPIITETLFGISLLPRATRNLTEWQQISQLIPCYIPDESDAYAAAELQISLRKRGWQLETVDAIIASIALRYNLILLTTDKDFQAIPYLQIENWLA